MEKPNSNRQSQGAEPTLFVLHHTLGKRQSVAFFGHIWMKNRRPRDVYGGFHSHGGIPIAGWFLLGKIPSRNG